MQSTKTVAAGASIIYYISCSSHTAPRLCSPTCARVFMCSCSSSLSAAARAGTLNARRAVGAKEQVRAQTRRQWAQHTYCDAP
jgi:hypothetical protein